MNFQSFGGFLTRCWSFVNQNIVSEAIGAFIFGLIAAFLFNKISKTREIKELFNRISPQLKCEVEDIQKVAKRMKEIFEKEGGRGLILFPSYYLFNTPVLSIVLHSEFLKVAPLQQSSLMITLLNNCNRANQVYEKLNQLLQKELVEYSNITMSSTEPNYWSYLNFQTIKNHFITSLKEYLLPSIIETCDKLLFQLREKGREIGTGTFFSQARI